MIHRMKLERNRTVFYVLVAGLAWADLIGIIITTIPVILNYSHGSFFGGVSPSPSSFAWQNICRFDDIRSPNEPRNKSINPRDSSVKVNKVAASSQCMTCSNRKYVAIRLLNIDGPQATSRHHLHKLHKIYLPLLLDPVEVHVQLSWLGHGHDRHFDTDDRMRNVHGTLRRHPPRLLLHQPL